MEIQSDGKSSCHGCDYVSGVELKSELENLQDIEDAFLVSDRLLHLSISDILLSRFLLACACHLLSRANERVVVGIVDVGHTVLGVGEDLDLLLFVVGIFVEVQTRLSLLARARHDVVQTGGFEVEDAGGRGDVCGGTLTRGLGWSGEHWLR